MLLPSLVSSTGLSKKVKRFTLLRSPLGNKTSKDQFERIEYSNYFFMESHNACTILQLLDVLNHLNDIKFKVKVSKIPNL